MENLENLGLLLNAEVETDDAGGFWLLNQDGVLASGLVERLETTDPLSLERALSHLLLRTGQEKIAILSAPEISRDAERRLKEFVDRFARGRAWGFVDDNGDVRIVAPDLEVDERARSVRIEAKTASLTLTTHPATVTTTRNQSLFTDLNEWLLKVMLLDRAPEKLWDKPRLDLHGPVDLSKADWVNVSQGKAYQFAHTLKEMDFLKWRRGTFELVDHQRLLSAWLEVARTRRPHRIPVRSPLGDSVRDVFRAPDSRVEWAYAGPLAAELYGMRHIQPVVEEVYVWGNLQEVAGELMLERCEPSQAAFYLVRPLHSASIARGVQEREGERGVDVVQSALDSVRRAARGAEQAEYVTAAITRWFE